MTLNGLLFALGFAFFPLLQEAIQTPAPPPAQITIRVPPIVLDDPQDVSRFADVIAATGVLFERVPIQGYASRCTVTIINRAGDNGYYVLGAGHCVGQANDRSLKNQNPFYVYFEKGDEEDDDNPDLDRAKIVIHGKVTDGIDFAVLRVKTKRELPIIPIGDSRNVALDAPIVAVTAPMDLGRLFVRGRVVKRKILHAYGDATRKINWRGAMVLSLDIAPGSSGSLVIDAKSKTIVGIVVGNVSSVYAIAVPITKFLSSDNELLKKVLDGLSISRLPLGDPVFKDKD